MLVSGAFQFFTGSEPSVTVGCYRSYELLFPCVSNTQELWEVCEAGAAGMEVGPGERGDRRHSSRPYLDSNPSQSPRGREDFKMLILVLQVWAGIAKEFLRKCKLSDPTLHLLNQKLWDGPASICVSRSPPGDSGAG